MQPQFLVRHFPAPKLQLHANLVSAIEEFFAVTHFCQVIVLVDVHPDFAGANPTVYAKLVLQFNQSPCSRDGSAPSRRIFLDRNLRIPPSPVWPEHSGTAAAAIDRGDGLTLIIASQGQVVGNIFTLARRIWS